MEVRAQTNLVKRGSIYYFRKKIPLDLREHYGCESIRKSLREFPAAADAKREAGRLADLYEREFYKIRPHVRWQFAPAWSLEGGVGLRNQEFFTAQERSEARGVFLSLAFRPAPIAVFR